MYELNKMHSCTVLLDDRGSNLDLRVSSQDESIAIQ